MTEAEQKLLKAMQHLRRAFNQYLLEHGDCITETEHISCCYIGKADEQDCLYYNIFGGKHTDVSFRKYGREWKKGA